MQTCMEILSVPLRQSAWPLPPPLTELCWQLQNPGDGFALYWLQLQGQLHCCICTEEAQARGLELALRRSGYGVQRGALPPLPPAEAILCRNLEVKVLPQAGGPPLQKVQLQPMTGGPLRSDTLFYVLQRLPDGCGVAFFVRLSAGLPAQTAAQLSGDPVTEELQTQGRLYEACGCTFGKQGMASVLAAEAVAAYPGMQWQKESCDSKAADVFDSLAALPGKQPALHPLRRTYTEEEIQVLTDLQLSQGAYGLPVNPDTLTGPPLPAPLPDPKTMVVLGRNAAGTPVGIPFSALKKGVFVGGAPGSGKGNLAFSTMVQLARAGVSVLALEADKQEMGHLSRILPEMRRWSPQEGRFLLNPFSLPEHVTVAEYRPVLKKMLRAFKTDGPLEELYNSTLERCFAAYGFDDHSTVDVPGGVPFGISEFMEQYFAVLTQQGYSAKTTGDLRTAGMVRLSKLLQENAAVYDTCYSIPMQEMTSGVNLLELAALGTKASKRFFATMFLMQLCAYMRKNFEHTDRLRLVILMDESHLLLDTEGQDSADCGFAEDFAELLLLLRSVGVTVIIMDQSIHNIDAKITDVCQTKIFMGPSDYSGLSSRAQELHMTPEAAQEIWRFGPGEGLYYNATMQRPVYFASKNLIDVFHLEKACPPKNSYLEKNDRLCIETFAECSGCSQRGHCTLRAKASARSLAQRLLIAHEQEIRACLSSAEGKKQFTAKMQALLQDAKQQAENPCVWHCALVQFQRAYNRQNEKRIPFKL